MGTNVTNKNIYSELSYVLTGLFFKIHNRLGRFCKERQYADAFEKELKNSCVVYKRELLSPQEGNIGKDRCDFFIENKIIVEIKAKKFVTREDYYQVLRYLQSKNARLGLLVNFRNTYLKAKRIAN